MIVKRYILTYIVITILAQIITVNLSGCGGCLNYCSFVGTVADTNNNALADVQVSIIRPGYDSPVLEAATDGNGQYFWTSKSRGGYDGVKVKFEKSGYQTVEAEPFFNILKPGHMFAGR